MGFGVVFFLCSGAGVAGVEVCGGDGLVSGI